MELIVTGLHKSYDGTPALRGVDLQIAPGEICALIGRNGAGKTTLTSVVAGLTRPDEGSAIVHGVEVHSARDAGKFVGLAPQDLGVYPIISVEANLRFYARLYGMRGRRCEERINEVLALFDLERERTKTVKSLSGGQKRRVHTAAALLHAPPLLLLDEPTVGVDVGSRAEVLDAVRRLANHDGSAVLYTTHYLQEVEVLGASVAIIDDGRILSRGSIDEIVQAHSEPVIELRFDDAPPDVQLGFEVERDGTTLRIHAEDPQAAIQVVIERLEGAFGTLLGVEIVRPNLETAFLATVGGLGPDADHEGPRVS